MNISHSRPLLVLKSGCLGRYWKTVHNQYNPGLNEISGAARSITLVWSFQIMDVDKTWLCPCASSCFSKHQHESRRSLKSRSSWLRPSTMEILKLTRKYCLYMLFSHTVPYHWSNIVSILWIVLHSNNGQQNVYLACIENRISYIY